MNSLLDDMEGLREVQCTNAEQMNSSGFVEEYLMDFFNEENTGGNSSSSAKNSSNESLQFELIKLENREKVNITVGNNSLQPSSSFKHSGESPSSVIQPDSSAVQLGTSTSPGVTSIRFDVLQYWRKRRYSNPRIYRLAMVVLSAPSTQVTVERLFSQVKFILTDSRMRLSDVAIKDIMVLKMNAHLLEGVVDAMLEGNVI